MEIPENVVDWSLERLLGELMPAAQARALGSEEHLAQLARPGLGGSVATAGLDGASRLRLAAAFELARRRSRVRLESARGIAGPDQLGRLLAPLLADEDVEVTLVAVLDGRHRLLTTHLVSRGTLTGSLLHPREVFRPAIGAGAAAVALAHNHPSGTPEPSPEDLEVTERIAQAGQILGIPLLDHLVIGAEGIVALRETRPDLFSVAQRPRGLGNWRTS